MPRVAKDKVNKSKKKSNRTRNIVTENTLKNTKDDKFSFDEEIVIGLKRIDEPKVITDKKAQRPNNRKQKIFYKSN